MAGVNGGNNEYKVVVVASDDALGVTGRENTNTYKKVTVTVTDVDEDGSISLSAQQPQVQEADEDETFTATLTDQDARSDAIQSHYRRHMEVGAGHGDERALDSDPRCRCRGHCRP